MLSNPALQKGTHLKQRIKPQFYNITAANTAMQRNLLFCILHVACFVSENFVNNGNNWSYLLKGARQSTGIALLSPAGRKEEKTELWCYWKKLQMSFAAQLSQVILYTNTANSLLYKFFPVPLNELNKAKEEKQPNLRLKRQVISNCKKTMIVPYTVILLNYPV